MAVLSECSMLLLVLQAPPLPPGPGPLLRSHPPRFFLAFSQPRHPQTTTNFSQLPCMMGTLGGESRTEAVTPKKAHPIQIQVKSQGQLC